MKRKSLIPENLMFSGWERVVEELLVDRHELEREMSIARLKNGSAVPTDLLLQKLYEHHPDRGAKL